MKKFLFIVAGLIFLTSSVALADETVGVATSDVHGNAFFYKEGDDFVVVCSAYKCKKLKIEED